MNSLRLLVLSLCALALGACSSFDRDWRAAASRQRHAADQFSGAWDGKWTSEKHRLPTGQPAGGRLRCIFIKEDAAHYRARFYANWLCFGTGYETTFATDHRAGGLDFHGEQDLGAIFGGVYRYDGRVVPGHFLARFSSRYDHGVFDMRPASAK